MPADRPAQSRRSASHGTSERSCYDTPTLAIRLTLPHRYDFGPDSSIVGDDLLRPQAWDSLRLETSGPFSIASDRGELEAQADARPEIGERMRVVDAWLRERDARTLVSYGAGGGCPKSGCCESIRSGGSA